MDSNEKPAAEAPPDALRERVGAVVDEAIGYAVANSERLWSKEFRAAVNEFRSRILSLLPAEGPRSALREAEQKEPLDLDKIQAWFEEDLPGSSVDRISNRNGLALIAEVRRLQFCLDILHGTKFSERVYIAMRSKIQTLEAAAEAQGGVRGVPKRFRVEITMGEDSGKRGVIFSDPKPGDRWANVLLDGDDAPELWMWKALKILGPDTRAVGPKEGET